MASAAKSLRLTVEHWLAPGPSTKARLAEFTNRRAKRQCYGRVKIEHRAGPVGMFFFRSDDGNWRMFPPECERPAMRTTYLSERSLVLST
jgi:hypothetical protein